MRSQVCLCLTGKTLQEDLDIINKYRNYIDMVELRVDHLANDERLYVRKFPELAGLPCILTIRRTIDGGAYYEGEATRTTLFARALAFADQDTRKNFAYIDLETDFSVPSLEEAALAFGTKIIRSYHNMTGMEYNIADKIKKMRITGHEIPKIACMPSSLSDVTKFFQEAKQLKKSEQILCLMGEYGLPSRILSNHINSFLTYTSPQEKIDLMKNIGHIDPISLQDVYNFRIIDDNTKFYGITGYPLSITDSPKIHNQGYRDNGMNAAYIPLRAKKVEEALEFAEEMKITGLSVTIPHKEAILPDLQQVSEIVGEIGACNTAVKQGDAWIGYNTDAAGLQKALCDFLGVKNLARKKVAIIGAGGAAKAAAFVVKQLKGKACVFNRTVSKAKLVAERFGFKYASLDPTSEDLLETYSDLIIQTTSIGMGVPSGTIKDDENQVDPIPFYTFHGHEAVYDIIYKPEETPIMLRAKAAGCTVENGYSMLLNQAYGQFSLFTGVEMNSSSKITAKY